MNFDVTNIVILLLTAVTAYLLTQIHFLKQAADNSVNAGWQWVVDEAAKTGVRAAEQLLKGGDNEDKLSWAVAYVEKTLVQYHLTLDETLVRGAIEKAVAEMKRELPAE